MKNLTLVTIGLTALSLAACGDDEASTSARTTPTPSPAFGVYTREVTEADIERTMAARHDAAGFEPSPAGRWQLTIAPAKGADVIKVTDPDGLTIEMDGKVEGSELRLVAYAAPERGAFCDQAISVQAKYVLTVQDSGVELKPSEEACADRDSVLTGTWEKG